MDASQGSSSAAAPAVDPGVSSAVPHHARPDALAAVGRELGADRVYLFENIRDADGRLWMNLTSEWRRDGVRGVFDDPRTTLHPYSPDFIRWIEVLGDHRVLTGTVANLPEPERRILAAEGTLSLIAVPIAVADGWWGFLGADDCNGAREWSAGETELLRVLAGVYQPTSGAVFLDGRITPLLNQTPGIEQEDSGYENIITIGMLLGMSLIEIVEST